MTTSPKITVIIPTRERCDVLEKSLRSVTSQNYGNLEILVSDNFSGDDTFGVVQRAKDERIRYINTGRRVSMSHNWEFALSHVTDGWVAFIGDDDGLLPEAIESVASIISSASAMAIRSTFCTYEWPETAGNRNGRLVVPLGQGLSIRDSANWMSKVMNGWEKYTQLPMIYNGGFAHISLLKKIKERTGSFFLSSSPDVYSAISIASVVDNYVYSKTPFFISGTSKHSIGTSFYSKSERQDPAASIKFSSEGNLPFHTDMPLNTDGSYPLSLHALTYEAFLQSAALRTTSESINHRQQLKVIIGTSGVHKAAILEWADKFASVHGLDYEDVKKSATKSQYLLQSYGMAKKVLNAMNSVITESVAIRNIFEASIAASVIRSSPSRFDTLGFLAGRAIRGWT